jgi:hypothetical protein
MKKQKALINEHLPNIAFIGKTLIKGELASSTPPTAFNTSAGRVDIADVETQAKPFYHIQADLIIRTFPNLYKRFTQKGK